MRQVSSKLMLLFILALSINQTNAQILKKIRQSARDIQDAARQVTNTANEVTTTVKAAKELKKSCTKS